MGDLGVWRVQHQSSKSIVPVGCVSDGECVCFVCVSAFDPFSLSLSFCHSVLCSFFRCHAVAYSLSPSEIQLITIYSSPHLSLSLAPPHSLTSQPRISINPITIRGGVNRDSTQPPAGYTERERDLNIVGF